MLKYRILELCDFTEKNSFTFHYLQKELRYLVTRSLKILITSLFLFISVDGVAADQASAAMRSWDKILTKDFFKGIAKLNRTIRQKGNERIYMYSAFTGDTAGKKLLMSIVVAVGPAGKRLDPDVWKKAFAAASDIERVRKFPKVGARAQAQVPSFSPKGALSGVVFTTTDGLFDVLVSLYEASSSTHRKVITVNDASLRIESAYLGTFN